MILEALVGTMALIQNNNWEISNIYKDRLHVSVLLYDIILNKESKKNHLHVLVFLYQLNIHSYRKNG